MIATRSAPTWLRRSDQAVTWARTMLSPHRAVVIDCETTDLPGAITGRTCYQNLRNREGALAPGLTSLIRYLSDNGGGSLLFASCGHRRSLRSRREPCLAVRWGR